jgi:hypothetical protein
MNTHTANPKSPYFAQTLGWYALWGPLIGGIPYLWTVIGVPFAYALGLGPALICGALTTIWMRSASLPGPWHSAAFGALFGAVACVIAGWGVHLYGGNGMGTAWSVQTLSGLDLDGFTLFLLPHGIFAGSVLAARLSRKTNPKTMWPVRSRSIAKAAETPSLTPTPAGAIT